MKALVKFDIGRQGMEIRDIPVPEPGEGEVRIRIKAAGICASDIHSMRDERATVKPVVLGHEFSGIIDKVSGDSCGLKAGDWVTGLPACYGCGECEWCKKGEVTLCPDRKSVGTHRDGAMAEYMVMPAKFCRKIPGDAENKLAYAAAEPLACAVRGVYERMDVEPGEVAVVSGPGSIGIFMAQALKARGAYVIMYGLERDAHRISTALKTGAADEGYTDRSDLKAAVGRKRPGGADIVCEAAGVADSLNVCLDVVKTHGKLMEAGVLPGMTSCNFHAIFSKELWVTGTNSTAVSSWDLTMKLLGEKKLSLDPVMSLKLPLTEWEKGFDAAIDGSQFKILLIP